MCNMKMLFPFFHHLAVSCVTLCLLTGCALFQAKEGDGRTPLINAVIDCDGDKVSTLLKELANPDASDNKGKTALHYAVQSPDGGQIVEMLLNAGADVDAVDECGKTPSMDAARMGNLKNLQLLAEKGCSLSVLDKRKRNLTIFAAAAPLNSLKTLQWLEGKGVSIRFADKDGNTPISTAIDMRNGETARYLMKIFPSDLRSDRAAMLLALHTMKHAVFANNVTIVEQLLARGILLNSNQSTICKMLKSAQLENWVGTAASVGVISDGRLPLSWAAEADNLALVQLFIEHGASTFCKDKSGSRPIDYARSIEVIRYLRKAEKKEMKGQR